MARCIGRLVEWSTWVCCRVAGRTPRFPRAKTGRDDGCIVSPRQARPPRAKRLPPMLWPPGAYAAGWHRPDDDVAIRPRTRALLDHGLYERHAQRAARHATGGN